jgi:fumarylacetoacetase
MREPMERPLTNPAPQPATGLDETHDIAARTWVESAADHAVFPIQNLPLGIFAHADANPRFGMRIGDCVLDVGAALTHDLLSGRAQRAADAVQHGALNELMALPATYRRDLRLQAFDLLSENGKRAAEARRLADTLLVPIEACSMKLPARIGDYTDFYAGIHHAVTAGRMFRPDAPLLPNYKHAPVGYHGRASTVAVAPTPVHRPRGQILSPDGTPELAPSRKLDFELEIGIWMGAVPAGATLEQAVDGIFGYCLLNDWSARDIQRWEAVPLGPFLAKNFATSVSPWIVTPEALAPFRRAQTARGVDDPPLLDYLVGDADHQSGALAVDVEALIRTPAMRQAGQPAQRVSAASMLDLYWTPAQLVVHHGINGCQLQPGDLLGTGTISADGEDGGGCLLERTLDGRNPVRIGGEERTYLRDGDEVTLRAVCRADGARTIGFGQCSNRVEAYVE